MKENIKRPTLRIEENLLKKFKYVCRYNGRSINSQISVYIRETVEEYEKEHGEIDLSDCEYFL